MADNPPKDPPSKQGQEASGSGDEAAPAEFASFDSQHSFPDVPMARPVSTGDLPARGPTAEDISSSVVHLSAGRAVLQLVFLVAAGFVGIVFGGMVAETVPLPDERWDNVVITASGGVATILAAFLMVYSSGQRSSAIGWRTQNAPTDISIGLVGVFCAYALMIVISTAITLIDPDLLERTTHAQEAIKETFPPSSLPALIVMMVFVALWEEVVFRGFLLTRLYVLFRRWWVAILVSSVLFSWGHVYQGWVAVGVIGGLGIVLGALFVWRRSLLPPIVFHVVFNTVAVLALRAESEAWG